MNDFKQLAEKIEVFAQERDWDKFHSPKNLSMALNVEVAELMEHFQWLTSEQSYDLDEKVLAAVTDELADVLVYLVRLSDKLGVDLLQAVESKMISNALKYPADKVRGSAAKYTSYED